MKRRITGKRAAVILTVLSLMAAMVGAACAPYDFGQQKTSETDSMETPGDVRLAEDFKESSGLIFNTDHSRPDARNRLSDIGSYICYYSGYSPDVMEKMSNVDLAIIDARYIGGAPYLPEGGAPYIAGLKAAGTLTVVYLAVGEEMEREYDPVKGWYLSDELSVWYSYPVDPGNEKWQEKVLTDAKRLMAQGADGLFLDTIDSAFGDFPFVKPDMASLIRKIRDACPDAILIANRGFDIAADIAPVIDGYMFEGFSSDYTQIPLMQPSFNYNDRVANELNDLASQYGFRIISLDYTDDINDPITDMYRQRSADFGFLLYIAPSRLDSIY